MFMNPVFQELASAYQDVLFLVVDVDEVKVIYFPHKHVFVFRTRFQTSVLVGVTLKCLISF